MQNKSLYRASSKQLCTAEPIDNFCVSSVLRAGWPVRIRNDVPCLLLVIVTPSIERICQPYVALHINAGWDRLPTEPTDCADTAGGAKTMTHSELLDNEGFTGYCCAEKSCEEKCTVN